MSLGRGHRRFWVTGWFIAAGLAAPGCSSSHDELPRQPVAGIVLLDGHRLAHGTILFFPEQLHHRNAASTSAGDVIVDGRFSIPRDKGPTAGAYKISISGAKGRPPRTDRVPSPGQAEPSAAEIIPVRFNSETELLVEIPEGGIKELKIELDSK